MAVKVLKSQRDEPGTLREYETIFILRSDATTDQIQEVNARVRRVIEELGGKVLNLHNWGKRKLAYELRKQLKGIYLYWLYLANEQLVAEIERNLRMLDIVIRYFSVKVDESVNPQARPSVVDDETFAAAAAVVPDEEDAYMTRSGGEEEGAFRGAGEDEEEGGVGSAGGSVDKDSSEGTAAKEQEEQQ